MSHPDQIRRPDRYCQKIPKLFLLQPNIENSSNVWWSASSGYEARMLRIFRYVYIHTFARSGGVWSSQTRKIPCIWCWYLHPLILLAKLVSLTLLFTQKTSLSQVFPKLCFQVKHKLQVKVLNQVTMLSQISSYLQVIHKLEVTGYRLQVAGCRLQCCHKLWCFYRLVRIYKLNISYRLKCCYKLRCCHRLVQIYKLNSSYRL